MGPPTGAELPFEPDVDETDESDDVLDEKDEKEGLRAENATLKAKLLKIERDAIATDVWESAGFNVKALTPALRETITARGERPAMEAYVSELRKIASPGPTSKKPTAPPATPQALTVDNLVSQLFPARK